MTQEEKQLLLQDICGRLPYKVKCLVSFDDGTKDVMILKTGLPNDFGHWDFYNENCSGYSNNFKPYLRPMSSMTEEEKNELRNILWFGYPSDDNDRYSHRGVEVKQCLYDDEKHSTYNFDDFIVLQNFLLKNHFDYCGLIEKGLALEAKEGMYNFKQRLWNS